MLAGSRVEVRNDQTAEEIRAGLDQAAQQRQQRLDEEAKRAEQVRLAAIEQQRQAEEAAEAERQKAAEEAQKIADKQAARISEGIAGMERRNQLEKMKRDGLEKEAHILAELDRLEKDRALTAEETARARAAAGAAFDLRQKELADLQTDEPTRDRPRAPDAPTVNALERIGAMFGGKVQLDPVPRQHLEVARRQERHLEKIANRPPIERQPEFV
jgi:membrane protein involved in colicin uptake